MLNEGSTTIEGERVGGGDEHAEPKVVLRLVFIN